VTSEAHLDMLARLGFQPNLDGRAGLLARGSASHRRRQTREQTTSLVAGARRHGFGGINFDLVYGLPAQRPESFANTLAETVALRPDRVAVYSFAYLPMVRSNQKLIDVRAVPDRDTKFQTAGHGPRGVPGRRLSGHRHGPLRPALG